VSSPVVQMKLVQRRVSRLGWVCDDGAAPRRGRGGAGFGHKAARGVMRNGRVDGSLAQVDAIVEGRSGPMAVGQVDA
jgi:hypothetical protein